MFKKGVAVILVGILSIGNITIHAEDLTTSVSSIQKCVTDIYESSEYNYSDQISGKHKERIDTVVEKFIETLKSKGYSVEKHIAIYNSVINKIDTKLNNIDDIDSDNFLDLLDYIRYSFISYKELAQAELYCKKDAAKVLPNADEITKIDKEIMEMQDTLADFVEESFNKIIGELEKNFGVQEMGDLDMNLEVNLPNMNIDANINLEEYKLQQDVFDSQFSSNIKAFFKVDDSKEVMSFDMSGLLDLISKDGNIYAILENMNFSVTNIEEIQKALEKIKELSENKTYIKITADEGYNEIVSILRSLDPLSIVAEMRTMMLEPLFEVNEKVGDTYILVPTKFACDIGKQLTGRFDPFYSNEKCSESQYKKLVKESNNDQFQIFMKVDENVSEFGINAIDEYTVTDISISFDGEKINNATLMSMPTDKSYEGLKGEYISGKHINMSLITDQIMLDWKNKLQSDNTFSEAKISLKGKDGDAKIDGDFEIKSGNIEGFLTVVKSGEQLLSLTTNGEYSESNGTFKIENTYIFSQNPFSYTGIGNISDMVRGNFNINFLNKDMNSTVNLQFNTIITDKEVVNFELNTSSRTQAKEVEFKAPTKFKLIEEIEALN